MRIIPDNVRLERLIDSDPDTSEDAEYYEVSASDVIEIDFNDFPQFCGDERLVGTWGDTCIRDVPEMIELFIKAKIKEKKIQ